MRLRYGPRAQMVTLVGLGFAVWAAFQGKDPQAAFGYLAGTLVAAFLASIYIVLPGRRSRTNTPSPFATHTAPAKVQAGEWSASGLAGERKQDGHSSGLNAPNVRRAEYDLPWNTPDKGTPAPQPQPTPSGSLRLVETTIRGHQMRLDAVMANPTPAERDWIRYGDAVAQVLQFNFEAVSVYMQESFRPKNERFFNDLPHYIARAALALSAGSWAAGRDAALADPSMAKRWTDMPILSLSEVPEENRRVLDEALHYALGLFIAVLDDYYKGPYGRAVAQQREGHYRDTYQGFERAALYCFRAGVRSV